MTKIRCTAEIKEPDGTVLRCKFRGEDGYCAKDEIEVGEEESILASCYDVEWVQKETKND